MTKIRISPYLFPYKKISPHWLGGYACAAWPVVRVTCFGLSELSVYTSSVIKSRNVCYFAVVMQSL
jgi:hypothetical protein